MKKSLVLMVAAILTVFAVPAFAQEAAKIEAVSGWAIFLGAGLSIGLAALGTGIGMGRAIGSALEGVSRNPSVAQRIMTMMIIGLALIESLAIYALVVSLILLFVA